MSTLTLEAVVELLDRDDPNNPDETVRETFNDGGDWPFAATAVEDLGHAAAHYGLLPADTLVWPVADREGSIDGIVVIRTVDSVRYASTFAELRHLADSDLAGDHLAHAMLDTLASIVTAECTPPAPRAAFVTFPRPDLGKGRTVTMRVDAANPGHVPDWTPYDLAGGPESAAVVTIGEHAETMAVVTGSVSATQTETVFGVEVSVTWMRNDPRMIRAAVPTGTAASDKAAS